MCKFIWLVAVFAFIVLSQVTAKGYSNLKQPVSYHPTQPAHEPALNLEGVSVHGVTKLLSIQPWISLGPTCIQDLPSRAHSCWQDLCPSVKDGGVFLSQWLPSQGLSQPHWWSTASCCSAPTSTIIWQLLSSQWLGEPDSVRGKIQLQF